MILRAVSKRGKDVPEYVRHPVIGPAEALEYALIPGNSYVAYGFTVWQDHIWFYVCDEDYPSVWYPIMHPAALFHVVDPRLSKYWVFGHHPEAPNGRHLFIVSFPEWAGDQGFYERLVDRSETALRIFQEYKGLRPGNELHHNGLPLEAPAVPLVERPLDGPFHIRKRCPCPVRPCPTPGEKSRSRAHGPGHRPELTAGGDVRPC